MKAKYPLVSVIIPNYNGVRLGILEECLKKFINIDYPNYELILVDNASTDNSIQVAQKIFKKNPKFKIIKNPVNMYSEGLNLGWEAAKGEYIAYCANDTAVEKKYFTELVEAFKRYPKMVLAQGKILMYYDHSVIDTVGESIDIYANPVTAGYQSKDKGQYQSEDEIFSSTGTACMIKKSIYKKVGKFDPTYGIGYEDFDFSLRIRQQGFEIRRIPSAVCYHKKGMTDLSPMIRVKVRFHFNKNRLSTMIKNYPLPLLLKALPVTIFIYLGLMIWDLVANRDLKLALTRPLSVVWVLFHLPFLIKQRGQVRSKVTRIGDEKILKFFSKGDVFGKTRAVILDKFSNKLVSS